MNLALDSHEHAGWSVLTVTGEIDACTAGQFAGAIRQLLPPVAFPAARGLIIDMSGVASLDSSGLGVLVGGHQRTRRCGRAFRLSGTSAQLRTMLFLTGLTEVLEVFVDVAATAEEASASRSTAHGPALRHDL